LDDVLEEALAKNPAIRTASVGAFADALGKAYGLTGDHRQWAVTPTQQLGAEIAAAMPGLLASKVAPLLVSSDPFANPPPPAPSLGRGMDQAFAAAREAENQGLGVPVAKPQWLLPVIVGLVALVVGGAVTLVVMMGK
jgi:serine/threonine-protein kinase